jgi:lipoyl(octanoyl) transferase
MPAELSECTFEEMTLQVYLLGCVDFETLQRLQRRLHFDITGDRRHAALIVCEHPPLITVGRRGSRSHIRLEADELRLRGWPIRWVNRGGGCVLHLPGQLAMYPILPLDRLHGGIADYLHKLNDAIRDLLADFSIHGAIRADDEGVWVGSRLLAALGVSVCDWVTGYGAYVNIHPALDLFDCVTTSVHGSEPMTSLERERRGSVRPSLVRERLIEHFQRRFGFARIALFSDHPLLADGAQRCRPFSADAEAKRT